MGSYAVFWPLWVCIIVPFFRYKWQMLADVVATNLLMALNFTLIGQIGSAAFLCGVAAAFFAEIITLMTTLYAMYHYRKEQGI